MKTALLLLSLVGCQCAKAQTCTIDLDAGTFPTCGDGGCIVTVADSPTAVIYMSHAQIRTYRGEIAWTEDNWATYLLSTDGCRAVDAGLWDCCGGARLRDGGCGALPSY